MSYDVAIIGGGPSGSTCASLLRKYAPELSVLVLERENFPREHVGESQLPPITRILAEMGVWDKVEAAGFPIKTGAIYRWGTSDELWKLDFLVGEKFEDNPRPEPLAGQRTRTTFHVERAIYDEILLDHAADLGAEVREGAKVVEILREGDRVHGIHLADDTTVTARWYVDASGHAGILRRQMGVGIDEPSLLKNLAIWDYWTNEAWAETVCKGGIRARIFSIGYGWIWFLPLSTTKASVGFVTHSDHYRECGLKPTELYAKALADEPFVSQIMPGAVSNGKVQTTKDWSFTAERLTGENWFLVGESSGFADPILAAGMSLAQAGARELAYTIAALHRNEHDEAWLKEWYGELSLRRVRQHIRFADFWYTANAHFTDLQKYTQQIAADAGLRLEPQQAFQWLSQGGFATDQLISPSFGTYDLGPAKAVLELLTGNPADWQINQVNDLKLNLAGAKEVRVPAFRDGKIVPVRCYQRGARLLPLEGYFNIVVRAVQHERDVKHIMQLVRNQIGLPASFSGYHPQLVSSLEAIESMLAEGWLKGTVNKKRPFIRVEMVQDSVVVATDDPDAAVARRGATEDGSS